MPPLLNKRFASSNNHPGYCVGKYFIEASGTLDGFVPILVALEKVNKDNKKPTVTLQILKMHNEFEFTLPRRRKTQRLKSWI